MGCGCFFKWWIYISIILILIFGIVVEVIFIVMACGKFADATDSKGALIAVGTIFLVICLVIVVFGFCGICKKRSCPLITYAVLAILLCAGFFVAFALLLKNKNNVSTDFEKVCDKTGKDCFIQDLNNVYKKSLATTFCTSSCKCKTDSTKFQGSDYANAEYDSTSGASKVSECPTNPVSLTKKGTIDFLKWLEEEKDCSGVCEQEKWYYFSDVNRGPPKKKCREPLKDYLDSKCY